MQLASARNFVTNSGNEYIRNARGLTIDCDESIKQTERIGPVPQLRDDPFVERNSKPTKFALARPTGGRIQIRRAGQEFGVPAREPSDSMYSRSRACCKSRSRTATSDSAVTTADLRRIFWADRPSAAGVS